MRSMFRLIIKKAKTHIVDSSIAPLPRGVREDVCWASHHHEPHAEVIIMVIPCLLVTYPWKYLSHHAIPSIQTLWRLANESICQVCRRGNYLLQKGREIISKNRTLSIMNDFCSQSESWRARCSIIQIFRRATACSLA